MRYTNVYLDAIVATLPEVVVTTAEIEERLAPLYERLRLPFGRLEHMTGIRQRRIWQEGMSITAGSVKTVEKLLTVSQVDSSRIGALVHGSVCRDFLEPATACGVHHQTKLPANCCVYDISNACLGILSGAVQIANMIELGQIDAGIVVGTESSRSLMDATIDYLNRTVSLDRHSIKKDFASLTIGSGSAAMLLTNSALTRTGNRLLGGAMLAKTAFCHLCQSDNDQSGGDAMQPLMATDSEGLLHAGIAAAEETFPQFLDNLGWSRADITKIFCHQVGKRHSQLLWERLGLSPELSQSTFEELGNTGSAALPTAAALALDSGFAGAGDNIALLGIGSGINVVMLGVDWQKTLR